MGKIKEEIAKKFDGKIFAFLLDTLEIYITNKFEVLAEINPGKQITLYFFENSSLRDVEDILLNVGENADTKILDYLNKHYNISKFEKKPLANKYDILLSWAKCVFVIRDKEETRGGEYVELMHILFADKYESLWFMKNREIQISSMLEEYLDLFGVKIREYSTIDEMITSVLRILGYS